MGVEIVVTDSQDTEFVKLIALLDEDLYERYGELQKKYDKFNKVVFIKDVVVIRKNGEAVACGAFKEYDSCSVEIKRVFVKKENRRQGLSKLIINKLEELAESKGYEYSVLETGQKQHEAISLYKSRGYEVIPNYGPYSGDSNSVCMKKLLRLESGFVSVYEAQYDKLFSVAYRLTGRKEDAEDVIQEAFMNAYKSYKDFRGESQISTWLYKIVVNCSYNYIKKQKKLPVVDISANLNMNQNEFFEMISSYEPVEDVVLTNDMRESCLQLFLKCIPKKQKIAFVLKVLLDLSAQEVASIMDISVGAVKTSVYRARLSMKENMEGKCSYINPVNPCNCKNWVAYAIKNNRMDQIQKVKLQKTINYDEIYTSEMDFLSKVVMLYNNYPERQPYKEFVLKIKDMISSNSLQILS